MRGMSQQDLANKLDLNKVAISQYERGVRRPSIDIVSALCDIFNVSSDYLLGEDDMTIRIVNTDEIKKLDSPRRIPVLGRVAAGIPIDAIEDIIDWEDIAEDAPGEYFGLKIKGDSMMPRIVEGDVVIVHSQPDAESGDVVIVQINGDTATCKRLAKYDTGISLISFNPMYAPINFTNEEIKNLPVTIIGKVVENRQKY
jgi:repressor LexA